MQNPGTFIRMSEQDFRGERFAGIPGQMKGNNQQTSGG